MGLSVFKALSNEVRYKIIKILLETDSCLNDLSKIFDKDFSVLYRHVKELEKAGLVEMKREGKFYTICIKNKELVKKLLELANEIENIQ